MTRKGIRPSKHSRNIKVGKNRRFKKRVLINPDIKKRVKVRVNIFRRQDRPTLSNVIRSKEEKKSITKELSRRVATLRGITHELERRQTKIPGFFERRKTKKLVFDPEEELVERRRALRIKVRELEQELPPEGIPSGLAQRRDINKRKVLDFTQQKIEALQQEHGINFFPNIYWDWQDIPPIDKNPIVINKIQVEDEPEVAIQGIKEKMEMIFERKRREIRII